MVAEALHCIISLLGICPCENEDVTQRLIYAFADIG